MDAADCGVSPTDSSLREGAVRLCCGCPWCSWGGDVAAYGCEFPSQTRRPRHSVGWREGGSPETTVTCSPPACSSLALPELGSFVRAGKFWVGFDQPTYLVICSPKLWLPHSQPHSDYEETLGRWLTMNLREIQGVA